jgi:rod shape-determining protein MreC
MFALRSLTQGIETRMINARSYLHLQEINESLARENMTLRNRVQKLEKPDTSVFRSVYDTLYNQQYTHTFAEVIDNTVNRQKNFFTINKGKRSGVVPDMSVISDNGVAGVVVGCSDNYSLVMSVLNLDFKLSARVKKNGYFGSLNWDGRNYRYAALNEIPQHVPLSVGDTIETTGYSAIFPEGMMVGTITEFERNGGDFYTIRVELATDFKNLQYVDVIGNIKKKELIDLQNSFQ